MLTVLARIVVSRPRTVILAWALASLAMAGVALVGIDGQNVFDRMSSGAPGVAGSESAFVRAHQDAQQDPSVGSRLSIAVSDVDITDPEIVDAVTIRTQAWTALPDVLAVVSPVGVPAGPSSDAVSALVRDDGRGAVITVTFAPEPDGGDVVAAQRTMLAELREAIESAGGSVAAFSEPLLYNDFTTLMKNDLVTGELVALPLALMVMVLIFGGFLAASTPLMGALASIAGGLVVLYGFSFPISLDDSSLNVVIVLAIGLSVDYGLLMVSRFREELSQSAVSTEAAIATTMSTAGRTVLFSALTVAIAVGGLLTFEPDILRGIGAAALGAVVMCLLSALTLVPAVAYLLGRRLVGRSVLHRWRPLRRVLSATSDVERDTGAFSALAARVQRRPWVWLTGSALLLAMLAAPALGIHLRNSGVELLPADNDNRVFLEAIDAHYPQLRDPSVVVLTDAPASEAAAWARENLAQVDGVAQVREVSASGDLNLIAVTLEERDGGSAAAAQVVRDIRELDAPGTVWVGGQAANQIDFQDSLARGAPVALGLVVLATFVLLFLMTGSVLVPLKALVINLASLLATVGVVTWVFQGGHLDALLGFTSAGGVESYVLVLIVAFAFGLAMDYDLFFLARIKELYDAGVPNDEAVRRGLQRSGRIITGAAAVIILVFLGFAAGDVLVIKQVGFGLAFAVLLDATVVRMILVPATMTLLGDYNWWAPRPLRALYRRLAVTH